MPFANRVILLFFALTVLWLSGCVTPPRNGDGGAGSTATKAIRSPDASVSPKIQREYKRALAEMKAGHHKKAEQLLLSFVRTHPKLAGPNANLGILYQRMDRNDDAEQVLKKAIKINSSRAAYHNQLGILYRNTGRFKDARRAYEKAIRVDPNYPYARLNLGILFDLYLRKPKQALRHYQQYQLLLPNEDKQVSKWITDLQRRTQTANKNGRKEKG